MVLSALAEIRVGKIRVILSGFCVACLVATVTLVTAVAGLTQQAAQKYFEQQTGRPGTLQMYVGFGGDDNGPKPADPRGLADMREGLKRYDILFSALSTSEEGQVRVPGGRVFRGASNEGPPAFQFVGSDSALSRIRNLKLIGGRWLSPTDDRRLEPSLVVTKGFLAKTGIPRTSALGSPVELAAGNLWVKGRIVGVLDIGEEAVTDFNGQIPQVYLPFAAMTRLGMPMQNTQFVLRVPPERAKQVSARLRADAKSWTGVTDMGIDRQYGDFGVISGKLRLLMYGVAVAMLALGSLPVLVLGIFAVRQRRSEFGVHRCFGATGSDLFLTVLLEALITCSVAGLAGVLGAFLISGKVTDLVLRRQYFGGTAIDTSFPWEAAQLGLGVAVCVGVFTGLIPAWRAMQRSVIRAIRA
ncbi:ABC transporter permease [Actinocorallia longicatena]